MSGMQVDTSAFDAAIRNAKLSANELKAIGYAGSVVIQTAQKMDVAVDTGATRSSISSHIIKATSTEYEDDIGAETEYAPYIEFGVASKPNYPIQPFVRPSAHGQSRKDALKAIARAFGSELGRKWK